MNPVEQHELLSEIAVAWLAELPAGWRRLVVDYAALGWRIRAGSGLSMMDGSHRSVPWPKAAAPLLARLRSGMCQEGFGTWFTLSLVVDAPSTFEASYGWDDAPFDVEPEQVRLEQQRFPRAPQYQPAWYAAALVVTTGSSPGVSAAKHFRCLCLCVGERR